MISADTSAACTSAHGISAPDISVAINSALGYSSSSSGPSSAP